MYRITKSRHIHFAHHVRGHRGACISIHGHTWKFEVTIEADVLDAEGFVRDFADIRASVLEPCHRLLDHALALGEDTWRETEEVLAEVSSRLVANKASEAQES